MAHCSKVALTLQHIIILRFLALRIGMKVKLVQSVYFVGFWSSCENRPEVKALLQISLMLHG